MSDEENRKDRLLESLIRFQTFKLNITSFQLSRNEFLFGVVIGIFGNIIASYLIELDFLLFEKSIIGLFLRVLTPAIILYYYLRTYSHAISKVNRRIEQTNQFLDELSNNILNEYPEFKEGMKKLREKHYPNEE